MANTEFTKIEQRILSPKHQKEEKAILWMGIVCCCLAIAYGLYFANEIDKVKKASAQVPKTVEQTIITTTRQEIFLKSQLLASISQNNSLWLLYTYEKTIGGAIFIFTLGMFLVVNYFKSRLYLNLIKKLKNSQQQNTFR